MVSLSQLAALLATLVLSSRVLSQVRETSRQEPAPSPAHSCAVPCDESEVHADDVCHGRPCWPIFCGLGDPRAYGRPRESVFVFAGQFTKRSMRATADVFNVTYDNNYIIALGYQYFPWASRHFDLGWEVGVGNRFNYDHSVEVWGGPVLRHGGINLFDRLTVTASFTAGFSAVTESMGHERVRERSRARGNATFLVYLGPEIAISNPAHPNIELFYRLHHRSGAHNQFGGMVEGYNANVLGLRFRF
jgi:hypothetical protein